MKDPLYLIHPSDLSQRRKRCRAEADRLLRLQRETIVSCNICSSHATPRLSVCQ